MIRLRSSHTNHPIIALLCIFMLSALASMYCKAKIKSILWTLFKITVRNRVKADKITIKPQPQTNQGERSTPRPTYEESVISLHYFVTGICLFFQIAVHTRMLCANKKIRVCTFTMWGICCSLLKSYSKRSKQILNATTDVLLVVNKWRFVVR